MAEERGVRLSEGKVELANSGTGTVGLTVDGAGKAEVMVNNAVVWQANAAGVRSAGRVIEKLTPTDVDAQNNTLTVAQIVAGIVVHTSASAGGTVTTDTAANIIAGSSGAGALANDGDTIKVYYVNDGTQTLTFAGGTGVTIADTGATILVNQAAIVLFRRASSTTVVAYVMSGV